jgi:hypothetical protein
MKPYTVTFIGDFFTLRTSVELDLEEPDIAGKSPDELLDVATELASRWLNFHYGWDVKSVADEIETVEG